jgi:tetratricopeptide (TPR) repeat protein
VPIIYNVSIEPIDIENRFRITWKNAKNNTVYSFEQAIGITPEEKQWLWQMTRHRQIIGEKLFAFLDGEGHRFQQALEHAKQEDKTLLVNLHTCKAAEDWPFEVLAKDGIFLLLKDLHLVRCIPDLTEEKAVLPANRQLKLLFMACFVKDAQPELDFEKEEEAIFRITENLAVDMEVEDSGSLEGLSSKLTQEEYDVVHLSGHAGIDKNGKPYFVMEDDTGGEHRASPDQLWSEALIKNPPRLVVLSGCRTGETPGLQNMSLNEAESSFARLLVEKYKVPGVLGWGRKVDDKEAIHAGKVLFKELSRGKSILDAVQRARYELSKEFPDSDKPAWPLLRLLSGGIPLHAIVKKEQRKKPKPRRMTYIYLKNSRVKVLGEGFVGRRRQLQRSLRGLKVDAHKVGLLIMGTGGLGKSCLAGKICERFRDHTLIIIRGRINTISIEKALKDAFIVSQDDNGKKILSQEIEMTDKLTHLCSTSFKKRNYLFLLDDFEQNLEGFEKGKPGELFPEAADLLKVLFHYLPFSGKMSQVVITSRYEFSLQHQENDIIEKRLEKIWLTGFTKTEQQKKLPELKNMFIFEDRAIARQLLTAGHGNPRLMEWIDLLLEQLEVKEAERLAAAIADKQEEFIHEHVIRELLNKGGASLEHFLCWFSIYRIPVLEEGVSLVAKKARVKDWKKLLRKGMALSLAEHDQAHESYQVTPLLREELLKGLSNYEPCHKAAFTYFKKVCEVREFIDPVLTEEWIYHALNCGEEDVASRQGGELVDILRERLAFLESRRIGEWILKEKKEPCSREHDSFLLNNLAATIAYLGDKRKAIGYYEQALRIGKAAYGNAHRNVAAILNNMGGAWNELGETKKAIGFYEQALETGKAVYGNSHPQLVVILNNLGEAWRESGAPKNAIDYYEQALEIGKSVYGDTHQNVAAALNNLGATLEELGAHREAIQNFKKALAIVKREYNDDHPNVAVTLNNLGLAWKNLGEIHNAIDYYEQVLIIDERLYEKKHPAVAKDLNNLGSAWRDLGDYPKAIQFFEQALAIEKQVFGKDHPNVGRCLNNLGTVWDDYGYKRKAIDYYKQALVVWKAVYGDKHQNVATVFNNLGTAYNQLGEIKKAIGYYKKAMAIDRRVFGKEHPNVARDLNNLGVSWDDLGDKRKAIGYYEQALAITKKLYGDYHPQVAITLNNLGVLFLSQGDKKQARPYFQQAYNIFNRFLGEQHLDTQNAKEWLDSCIQLQKEETEIA